MSEKKSVAYIYNRYREQILYMVFGVLTTAVSILVYAVFTEWLSMDELIANIISWVIAVMFAFVTNRIWVFRSNENGAAAVLRQMLTFYAGRVLTLLIEELMLWVFVKELSFNGLAVKTAAQLVVIVLNYIISKLLIFKRK